ncbi:MAG: DUF4810 domain-containing protein [Candidatus Accumulibacter sp.]|jgi:hypothetical protein|nr:DUF4810 domain-containing protein [Accumulibacter sp.]
MKTINIRVFSALALAVFLSGCATAPERLYSWGSYQKQVYSHLQGEDRQAQIEAMESDLEKIGASGKTPPPGFYAHLGLLYVETGNDAKAIASFETEKARFPESAAFMDFLLKKYKK